MRPAYNGTARSILICLFAFVFHSLASAQNVIRGVVVEAGTGRPVPAAFVELVDGVSRIATTVTDSIGEFILRTPRKGDAVLRVSRIGFGGTQRTIKLGAREGALPPITLDPDAVRMEPLAVPIESGVLEQRLQGYMRRRELGAGYFIGEQRLKNAAGAPLSDVLRGVPGISVSNTRSAYGPLIFTNNNDMQKQVSPFRRGQTPNSQMQIGPCPMQLYVDGRHFRTDDLGIDIINPQDLIGVEIFRSIAELPAEFGGIHARCGVVSVWTRRVPNKG